MALYGFKIVSEISRALATFIQFADKLAQLRRSLAL
jgi:hypothetical protein